MAFLNIETEKLEKELYESSLTAWFMKPLATTAGMGERSINEVQVLKELPDFFDRHGVVQYPSRRGG